MKKNNKPTPSDILSKYDLDEIDKSLLRHKIEYPTMTHKELGHIVGIRRSNVTKRLGKEKWKKAYTDYLMPPAEIFQGAVRELTKRYLALCRSKNEKIAERAIREVLQSAGILKRSDTQIENFEPMIIRFDGSSEEIRIINAKDAPKIMRPQEEKDSKIEKSEHITGTCPSPNVARTVSILSNEKTNESST